MKLRVWFIKPHVNFYVNIESEEYEYDLILIVKYFLFFFLVRSAAGWKYPQLKGWKALLLRIIFRR